MSMDKDLAKRFWVGLTELDVLAIDIRDEGAVKRNLLETAREYLGKSEDGKRDLIFEAVCSALGADWTDMPPHEAAKYRVATKQLRGIGATPSDIIRRAHRYEQMHPEWELTPTSLVTHWSTLKGGGATTRVADRVAVVEAVDEPDPETLVGPPADFLAALAQGVKAVPDC